MIKKTILIVDDEPEIREILTKLICNQNLWEVHAAKNGLEALELFKTTMIDLIITDLAMPEMNGFELLRRLKVTGKSVPTLVLTGHGDLGIVKQLQNYGVRECMTKPFQPEILLQSVRRLLTDVKPKAS